MDIAETGNIVLFGVSMAIVIPLLVEGFKELGMPESWKPWVTLALCFLASIVSVLINMFPDLMGPWYIAAYTIVSALVLWLIVTGLYRVGRSISIGGGGGSDGSGGGGGSHDSKG